MKAILREDKSGVSEVVGTILILGMTVTLFSVIIVWVSAIPAPVAQTRVDITPSMIALTPTGGVNITLTHRGGEALYPVPTVIYITDQKGNNPQTTDVATLHPFNGHLPNPSGLLDGTDSIWNIGERWSYVNQGDSINDSITVTIVDTSKGIVEWLGNMNQNLAAGPPIFLNVWVSGILCNGQASPLYAAGGFCIYAQVISPNNTPIKYVFANITAVWQVCTPIPLNDKKIAPDQVAGDGIFSGGLTFCMNPPYPAQSWTNTYVVLNATDALGHVTTTRFLLNVLPSPTTITNTQTIPSQLWQYIGFVQIRTGQVWLSNNTLPYDTTNTYTPFEVARSSLNTPAMFHFKMANHGNTTIFIDGFTEAFFTNTQSPGSSQVLYITAPCSTSINANAGGVTNYPGVAALGTFAYATYGPGGNMPGCQSTTPFGVFDINPLNQEMGGPPYTVIAFSNAPFGGATGINWPRLGGQVTYFIQILVAGMAGPVNYTYAQILGQGTNPYGCSGLGPGYNPYNHLNDPIAQCRTQWYAQVVPFNAMIVFG